MNKKYIVSSLLAGVLALGSCQDDVDVAGVYTYPKTRDDVTLKSAGNALGIKIGVGVDYSGIMMNADYQRLVAREFDNVTFGYQMKHGAIVKSDGSYDWSKADAMVDWCKTNNVDIFGHTLAWHSNQNASYLKSLVSGGSSSSGGENMITNGTFEADASGWSIYNGDKTQSLHCSELAYVRTGNGCMQMIATANSPTNQWKDQIHVGFTQKLESGKSYQITLYIRCKSGSGTGRCSTSGNAQYQGDFSVTTEYQKIVWPITGTGAEDGLNIDLGAAANTYYIDDVTVTVVEESTGDGPSEQDKAKIKEVFENWIAASVTHYKGKVIAWDVVNESMADGNSGLRTSANSDTEAASDVFYWTDYLGEDYAAIAFEKAHSIDSNALLFINDYNLESNEAKLDALIDYVKVTQAKLDANGNGAKIDGIGTQMHIGYMSYSGIRTMFEKLAATGLKVKVSELDVKVNTNKKANYTLTTSDEEFQARMYNFIVETYLEVVPESQRYGITVWGINDGSSWLNDTAKDLYYCPLLWNDKYEMKQAYYGMMEGLTK